MTCSNCNNELRPGAQFCSRCGAHIAYQQNPYQNTYAGAAPVPPMPVYPPFAYNRVARHLQALGILWLIYALWHTMTKIIGIAFIHSFLHWHNDMGFPFGSFAIWPFMLTSTLLTLALSLLAAYGLLNRQPWGRLMAIIGAVFGLVHPILGTALGIYTLWALAPAASGIEYVGLTAPAAPTTIAPTSTVSTF